MSRCWVAWVVVIVAWGMGGGRARAEIATPPPDDALEARFRAEIDAISPAAGEAWARGNAAREAARWEEALAAYEEASRLAPTSDHPRRRACTAYAALGRNDEAIAACTTALQIAPDSPYDKVSLAGVLGRRDGPGDRFRALELARAGVEALPEEPAALGTWCELLLQADDLGGELQGCVERYLAVAPDDLGANYLAAMYYGGVGVWSRANEHLDKARVAGLPLEEYRRLVDILRRGERGEYDGGGTGLPLPGHTFLWIALWVFVGWVGVLAILLTAGYLLSRATLRAVGAARASDDAAGTAREQRLRRRYRFVLAACGLYFYVSIPILIGVVVLAGGGVIYFFFAAGRIPVKLVLFLGLGVIVTVGAILRSVFVRAQHGELGHRIDLEKHPRLRALIHEVAGAVGTRPADVAYLTPGTDMAVTERAGMLASVRGARTERSLIMGVGLFDGMTQVQLRGVLAHEHGHFRNADTAGGGFALAVRRSLLTMIIRIAQAGAASWINPAWWFVRGYHRVYLVISQGASRLQEVLADRWAVQAYGTDAFVGGYTHVVERSVRFEHHADASLKEVIEEDRPLPNLYAFQPTRFVAPADAVTREIEEHMTSPPSIYDSHPSAAQRIGLAKELAVVRAPKPDDDAPIWALFDDRDAIERAMTAEVRENVYANQGYRIPDGGAAPTGAQ
jgi:Zn-dependent protease with chaperone function